jgi:hypothetical protein
MVTDEILSWIPDPVGKNWTSSEAVLFCGSAYAGIFSPYSVRPGDRTMPFESYAEAKALEVLQRLYFDTIIDPPEARGSSDRYYGKIEKLCMQGVDQEDLGCVADASYIALLDLCRASFVKRIEKNGAMRDICGTIDVLRRHADIFNKYVESATASEWLWRRLSEGQAHRIVAMGSIAEHGLLRLFQRRGQSIYLGGLGPIAFPEEVLTSTNGKWVGDYAYESLRYKRRALDEKTGPLKLDYWLDKFDKPRWWSICEDGRERWRLLPIYHPTSSELTGATLTTTKARIRSM